MSFAAALFLHFFFNLEIHVRKLSEWLVNVQLALYADNNLGSNKWEQAAIKIHSCKEMQMEIKW